MASVSRLTLGVDPGQRVDPTALALVEEVLPEAPPGDWVLPPKQVTTGREARFVRPRPPDSTYIARHFERLHGTPYPEIAARVAEAAVNARRLAPQMRLTIVIDATGVGRPVAEMIARAVRDAGLMRVGITAATFTHGAQLHGVLEEPELRVGKAWLVSRLQTLFQSRRVKLPAWHAEASAMLEELLNYEIKVSDDGDDRYGAFKVGKHDDLVTALGLACVGEYRRPNRIWSPSA